jgi:hypothetical protein
VEPLQKARLAGLRCRRYHQRSWRARWRSLRPTDASPRNMILLFCGLALLLALWRRPCQHDVNGSRRMRGCMGMQLEKIDGHNNATDWGTVLISSFCAESPAVSPASGRQLQGMCQGWDHRGGWPPLTCHRPSSAVASTWPPSTMAHLNWYPEWTIACQSLRRRTMEASPGLGRVGKRA